MRTSFPQNEYLPVHQSLNSYLIYNLILIINSGPTEKTNFSSILHIVYLTDVTKRQKIENCY